ncbi:MAG: hypothetical protein GXP25_09640 [Planctomycetes bacterium]|nr:hypothetical protein [Planctomycetota bacterium]
MKHRCMLVIMLSLFWACDAARADLRLSLTRSRAVVSAGAIDTKTATENLMLQIGPSYFWLDLKDYRRVYDFEKERVYTLHFDSKTYLDDSLQAVVMFREAEIRNRLGVPIFSKIENPTAGKGRQFELAHLFGMTLEGMEDPPPVEEVRGKQHRFTYEGALVAEFRLGADAIPDDLRGSFAKFIAYECGVHPFIRRQLCSCGRLFQDLKTVARMGDAMRVTKLHITSVANVEATAVLVPADFRFGPEPGGSDPVLDIICSVRDGTAKRPDITSADLRARTEKAIQEKHFAQAMVYFFQNMLQFGVEDKELLKKISDAAGKDEEFLLINLGLRRNNKAQARRALFALGAIDRSTLENDYILDVYKADALSTAGRVKESKWLLINVLRQNPYLAGAYKDLGGILFSEYDMPGAWRCWELCLKLCPGYSLLRKFEYYQERRRKRFPDFF